MRDIEEIIKKTNAKVNVISNDGDRKVLKLEVKNTLAKCYVFYLTLTYTKNLTLENFSIEFIPDSVTINSIELKNLIGRGKNENEILEGIISFGWVEEREFFNGVLAEIKFSFLIIVIRGKNA